MPDKLPHVTMVGLGYIGLPTAAVIARAGCTVLGLDVKQDVVDTINDGRIHIEEHDLDILVHDMVACGRLTASLEPQESDIFVIAVPTPVRENNEPDISFILQAAERIAPALRAGNLVILESTSPIGTTANIGKVLAKMRPDLAIAGQIRRRLRRSSGLLPRTRIARSDHRRAGFKRSLHRRHDLTAAPQKRAHFTGYSSRANAWKPRQRQRKWSSSWKMPRAMSPSPLPMNCR